METERPNAASGVAPAPSGRTLLPEVALALSLGIMTIIVGSMIYHDSFVDGSTYSNRSFWADAPSDQRRNLIFQNNKPKRGGALNSCPAASSIRHDHSTINPQSKPRPRAGVRGLRRSTTKHAPLELVHSGRHIQSCCHTLSNHPKDSVLV